LGETLRAINAPAAGTDNLSADTRRFYRVIELE
jgi:hypothetical protein